MKKTITLILLLCSLNIINAQQNNYNCQDYRAIKGQCIIKSGAKYGVVKGKKLLIPAEFDSLYYLEGEHISDTKMTL